MKSTNLHKYLAIAVTLLFVAILAVVRPASAAVIDGANQGGAPLMTTMDGAQSVPSGDPDGSGTAFFTLNIGRSTICYELTAQDIGTVTAAHIHKAPAGVAGPVVVPLVPPISGSSSGCATVDPELIRDILISPSDYYVNVHTVDFPAGAIRGQLGR